MDHENTLRQNDIRKMVRKAREELEQDLHRGGNAHAGLYIDQKISQWLRRVEQNPNHSKVKTYHLMKKQTPPEEATEEDFSGEDSVLRLFQGIRQEMSSAIK